MNSTGNPSPPLLLYCLIKITITKWNTLIKKITVLNYKWIYAVVWDLDYQPCIVYQAVSNIYLINFIWKLFYFLLIYGAFLIRTDNLPSFFLQLFLTIQFSPFCTYCNRYKKKTSNYCMHIVFCANLKWQNLVSKVDKDVCFLLMKERVETILVLCSSSWKKKKKNPQNKTPENIVFWWVSYDDLSYDDLKFRFLVSSGTKFVFVWIFLLKSADIDL